MDTWRFLDVDWLTYAETAIYRPVLMRAVGREQVPDTVTFCTFPKPSLVLNFFNDPDKDVDLDFCRRQGIPVCRVISNGGPILGDAGYTFTFLHLNTDRPNVPGDTPGMLSKTLTALAEGISDAFDVECRFRPLNDLEVRCEDGAWRKIGPSSCFFDGHTVQMGSGLQVRKPDTHLIETAIITPPEKFQDKEAKSVRDRITYLENAVGRTVDMSEIRRIYRDQIGRIFGVELADGELTDREKGMYLELEQEYTADDFFMERSEKRLGDLGPGVNRAMMLFKVPQGPLVRLVTFVDRGRLKALRITGTIHASPLQPTSPVHEIEKVLQNQPLDRVLFEEKIAEVLDRPLFSFTKVTPQMLAGKIHECASV